MKDFAFYRETVSEDKKNQFNPTQEKFSEKLSNYALESPSM
jgi:hypothetical protein